MHVHKNKKIYIKTEGKPANKSVQKAYQQKVYSESKQFWSWNPIETQFYGINSLHLNEMQFSNQRKIFDLDIWFEGWSGFSSVKSSTNQHIHDTEENNNIYMMKIFTIKSRSFKIVVHKEERLTQLENLKNLYSRLYSVQWTARLRLFWFA